jgi:hypothetical protein
MLSVQKQLSNVSTSNYGNEIRDKEKDLTHSITPKNNKSPTDDFITSKFNLKLK